ncbi:Zn(II)2Cys6 transcription factor [Phanerochaete sordida]|uniref:Zn(II)2Cys6 transcription factor n=1 Tax=Phanerochaete sordida TaxID=48140 RepID=A0A9P3LDW1_9APHY|nr:Zn(II)2Cys6 transcription factor [Phanerochaete sordida]
MPRAPKGGIQLVAISSNIPGSVPAGMSRDFSRMTIMASPEIPDALVSNDPAAVAFVKGGKRKRLSKACDACHKSKRRCDGTAPCSNCFFASKECTYTDSSGRPVPAPRTTSNQDRAIPARISTAYASTSAAAASPESTAGVRRHAELDSASAKRVKPETSPSMSSATSSSPSADSGHDSPLSSLDPVTQLQLIELFFAHCNPHRLIIHKPSFSASLTHERVPQYLIMAVCALAAPWCKDITNAAPMPRLAGVPFFQEALNLMFDASGRLLSEPTLATAQALCLLEMHEIAASHSWTKHYRYFDLALQVLEDALEVQKADSQTPHADLSPIEARQYNIERECTRRCFWLVQAMEWVNGIYTYRQMRPRSAELTRVLPLPLDENSFELGRTQPAEYLHLPAPRSKMASQFGHVCRVLSIYYTFETISATKPVEARPPALAACREAVQAWVTSLPDELRFSPETLEKQIEMFATGANTGAWCYLFIHTLHPCLHLELTDAEGRLHEEPLGWLRDQLDLIFKATGARAKNTILSACTIWTYSKYFADDPLVQQWDDQFETMWGFRVTVVADQWRKTQNEQQAQIGRTYPVEGVSQSHGSPAFQSASQSSSPTSQHAPTVRSPLSSVRSSPRDRPSSVVDLRAAARQQAHHPASPPQHQQQHFERGDTSTPRGLQPQQSLPSLKASGLLDNWRPPTEAFTQAVQISGPAGGGHGLLPSPHALGQPPAGGGTSGMGGWPRRDGQSPI